MLYFYKILGQWGLLLLGIFTPPPPNVNAEVGIDTNLL